MILVVGGGGAQSVWNFGQDGSFQIKTTAVVTQTEIVMVIFTITY